MSPKMRPDEVVSAALDAHQRGDAPRLAVLVEPRVLALFQRGKLAFLTRWLLSHLKDPAVVVGRKSQGDVLPSARIKHIRLAAIPQSPTVPELQFLEPLEFFARWADAWYRASEALRGESVRPPAATIGTVTEGSEWAHVLYRYVEVDLAPADVYVTTLRRVDDRWLIVDAPYLAFDDQVLDQLLSIAV